jgi:hypothetical protein
LSSKCFVAGAAAVLSGTCPRLTDLKMLRSLSNVIAEDVRAQVMGHVNGNIYERHYRSQVVDADVVSAFLDTPSDEALMKLMGQMLLTRDPNAPAEPKRVFDFSYFGHRNMVVDFGSFHLRTVSLLHARAYPPLFTLPLQNGVSGLSVAGRPVLISGSREASPPGVG